MEAELHRVLVVRQVRLVRQLSDFSRPNILQVQGRAFDWQQETEQNIVTFKNIWRENQMQWPVGTVVDGQSAPRILLVCDLRTYKSPMVDVYRIGNVLCFKTETQICTSVVKLDVV